MLVYIAIFNIIADWVCFPITITNRVRIQPIPVFCIDLLYIVRDCNMIPQLLLTLKHKSLSQSIFYHDTKYYNICIIEQY